MDLLEPDFRQPRPNFAEVNQMVQQLVLSAVTLPVQPFNEFVSRLRTDRTNGGAYLVAFDVGQDRRFDWFVSRNRRSEVLNDLVAHSTIRESLPELHIQSSPLGPATSNTGFVFFDQFLLQGTLASLLYHRGAYSEGRGDGQAENQLALDVCNAMFGLRFGEISCSPNYDAWTPWFHNIAWDVTIVVFDPRSRRLWILALTDTD